MIRRLALVTGASSGIGAALARAYAARGFDVAVTARRAKRLAELAAEIRRDHGVETYAIPADLVDPAAVDLILNRLRAEGRQVDVLVNNAGYGLPGVYAATSWRDQLGFLQVLALSAAELTHRVLPGMIERGYGRILNVSSLAALMPSGASHTLYGAAKALMHKFSQSLYLETLGQGVHVTCLCPGFTLSEFHDRTGTREQVRSAMPAFMWMTPEAVAAEGLAAVEKNKPVHVPGLQNKLIALAAKLAPDSWALAFMAAQSPRFRKLEPARPAPVVEAFPAVTPPSSTRRAEAA